MTRLHALVVAAIVGSAGCALRAGSARPLDSSRLLSEPGWTVAASTPEVRQREAQDCGAAALAMIAGHWRVPLSLDAILTALPEPAERGARLGDLRDVARANGLRAYAITGDRDTLLRELRAGRASIVGLLIPDGRTRRRSHFEVVVAAREADEQVVTIDPAAGWRVRSWIDLDAEWSVAGRPMLVVVGASDARKANTDPEGSAP